MSAQDWMDKDFYKILGVSKDADQKTIKKAYRKLARKYHPDQNDGDAAAETKFKEVGEAYQVLSDPKQRQQYDAIRAMAGGGARFSAGPGGPGAGHFDDLFGGLFGGGRGGATPGGSYAEYTFGPGRAGFGPGAAGGAGGANLNDLLSGLFGGAGGAQFGPGAGGQFGPGAGAGAQFGGPRASKGADLQSEVTLPFRQAMSGTTMKITVEGRQMTVRIPAGIEDGKKIRLKGKGRPGVNGGPAGNLVITVHVEKDPVFSLRDGKLTMVLPISVAEAINGTAVEVPLLDGQKVTVKIPQGTSSDAVLRLKGKGAKVDGKAGDLYIRTRIVVNPQPGQALKDAVRAVEVADVDFDPRADLHVA